MELLQYNSPVLDYGNFELDFYEEEAWYVVLAIVIIALGALVVLGSAVWCIASGKGKFTGGVYWKDGFSNVLECS